MPQEKWSGGNHPGRLRFQTFRPNHREPLTDVVIGQGMMSMHLSSITTLIGTSSLLLAHHPALFMVGASLTSGLLVGYLTAFFVVPGICSDQGSFRDRIRCLRGRCVGRGRRICRNVCPGHGHGRFKNGRVSPQAEQIRDELPGFVRGHDLATLFRRKFAGQLQ